MFLPWGFAELAVAAVNLIQQIHCAAVLLKSLSQAPLEAGLRGLREMATEVCAYVIRGSFKILKYPGKNAFQVQISSFSKIAFYGFSKIVFSGFSKI